MTSPALIGRRLLACAALLAAPAALGLATSAPSPARADEATPATPSAVTFRYAVTAKRDGKRTTRITRFVVRGVPAGSSFNITCAPAGLRGCPASGTIPARSSDAADGTVTYRVVTKRLRRMRTGDLISLAASHQGLRPHAVQLKVTRPGRVVAEATR